MSWDVANRVGSLLEHIDQSLTFSLWTRCPFLASGLKIRALGLQLGVVIAIRVSPHAQQMRQFLQKQWTHPWRHGVIGSWGTMVYIYNKHSDDDGKSDEDHNKEQVLSNQWDDFGWRRNDLLDYQEEDSERHQDGGGERDFLSFIRRKVKNQHCEERQAQQGIMRKRV